MVFLINYLKIDHHFFRLWAYLLCPYATELVIWLLETNAHIVYKLPICQPQMLVSMVSFCRFIRRSNADQLKNRLISEKFELFIVIVSIYSHTLKQKHQRIFLMITIRMNSMCSTNGKIITSQGNIKIPKRYSLQYSTSTHNLVENIICWKWNKLCI